MRTIEEAQRALKRVTFSDEQRARSQAVFEQAEAFLAFMWANAKPSAELTLATRSLQECLMWHSTAIANESKDEIRRS